MKSRRVVTGDGGIRKPLIAAAVSGLIAACVLLFLAFYRDARAIAVALLREEQRTHAEQAAGGIEDFFAAWVGTLSVYSRMKEIVDVDAVGRRDLRLLLEGHPEHIRGISRLDSRGAILASFPYGNVEGSDISRQAHVATVLRDRRPVLSDVFRSVQGFDALALHVPVFKGPAFAGTLAVLVDFESLARRHFAAIRVGATGHAWVVSRDATLLYTPLPGLVGKSATESFKDSPELLAMLADMLQGREGVATYTIDRGRDTTSAPVREHAVYLPIKLGNTFWSVVVASEERDLLGFLKSIRKRLALVIGLTCLGAALLAIVATKAWLILKGEEAHKLVEAELRESEERYATLFHANPAAVAVTRLEDNRLVDVNEAWAALTGYSREEAAGHPAGDFHLWTDPGERDRAIRMLKEQGSARIETQIRTKHGQLREVLMSGEIVGLAGERSLLTIALDITERKNAELALQALNAELARSNAELERFCSSVSHDLKEPARMVASYTGLLANRLGARLDDDGREFLGFVQEGAERMQLMIDDLLRYSRVATRGQEFGPVHLEDALEDALQNLAVALEESGGKVLHDALPTVLGDRLQLLQLFQNLIDNAVKFRRRDRPPLIEVGARREDAAGGLWTVSVRDNGIGMDPKFFDRIFVIFERLHTREEYPGTGVGLAICKRIVERHGGRIWVDSAAGTGSTFFFTLPAAGEPIATEVVG